MSNPFFINKGPISLYKIYEFLKINNQKKNDFKFYDIKDLYNKDIEELNKNNNVNLNTLTNNLISLLDLKI